jgi:VCBS repeat-containing protein
MKSNVQLQSDVRAELAWDPRVDDMDIHVIATDSVITLTGSVPTYASKWAAERAAERVYGVRAIANDLAVAVPIPFQRSDTDIAHAILNAIAWDVQVPDTKIKCAVSNGWVTLEGNVDWRYQRDASARAVRNLAGVRGVTNNIGVAAASVSRDEVTQKIKDALERRADRTSKHINVDTVDGIVTLTGSVPSFGDRRAAEGAAWSAPGVRGVRDELAVGV